MPKLTPEDEFRRWHLPWKDRVCEEVRPFEYGTVFRSPRLPSFWEYNCIRLEHPLGAAEMVSAADRELADCPHRFVEWLIPIPEGVARELRERGWMVNPLIYMLHDGHVPEDNHADLIEVDHDVVLELREIWYREDFGEGSEMDTFFDQAREVAELADVRVIAAHEEERPIGYAQVETHDGASEVSQVFVRPEHRGEGLGRALTARAIQVAADASQRVWICADRDGRPRRLYERLGFRPVVEMGVAIRLPGRDP